jgi:predicted Zn-dependent protease
VAPVATPGSKAHCLMRINNTCHARRTRAGLLAIGGAALVLCLLSGWVWRASYSSGARGAWRAVAQARHCLSVGRPDLAYLAVYHVRDEEPGSGEAAAVKGQVWIRLREYPEARIALERALTLQPNQFEVAVLLAKLNLDLGNGLGAIEVLERAARLRPGEFRIWFTMGQAFKDLGDNLRAGQAYEKAHEIEPDHGEALVALIDALLRGGQSDRAGPWVVKALARYPEDPVVLGFAAHEACDAHRVDDAMAMADRALRGDPANLNALLARARCLIARSQWKEALPEVERAAAASPHDTGSLHLLAIIEARLGFASRASLTLAKLNKEQERLESMSVLNQRIARNPDDPRLPWQRGQLALESGMTPLAARCFQAALALEPKFGLAQDSLAALQASQPDQQTLPRRASYLRIPAGVSFQSSPTSP